MPEAHIAHALERLLSDADALPAPDVDLSAMTQLPRCGGAEGRGVEGEVP